VFFSFQNFIAPQAAGCDNSQSWWSPLCVCVTVYWRWRCNYTLCSNEV